MLESGSLFHLNFAADYPVVAVGAPARTFFPDAADHLSVTLSLPEHAEVANAYGAVMGSVVQRAHVTVTQPLHGTFMVHSDREPLQFNDLEAACNAAESIATNKVSEMAAAAGAVSIEIRLSRDENHVHHDVDGDLFLETRITATATGRPDCRQISVTTPGCLNASMTDISTLHDLLEPHGLMLGGVLNEPEVGELPAGDNEIDARQLILVANAGSAIWRPFVDSPEYGDSMADPMDRWSRRIGEDIARILGGRAIFPFEGPPYPPFLNWAGQAGQVFPSPVSLFVHREYGLWQAWRFALAMPRPLSGTVPASEELSPCVNCPQPCLDACPVDAFSRPGLPGRSMRGIPPLRRQICLQRAGLRRPPGMPHRHHIQI